jgi:hypothetical protein
LPRTAAVADLRRLRGLAAITGLRGDAPRAANALPLVSLVTLVKDGERFLEEAIASVASQSYPETEHIIVDGEKGPRLIPQSCCIQ